MPRSIVIGVLALTGTLWAPLLPARAASITSGTFVKTIEPAPVQQVVPHALGERPQALVLWTVGSVDGAVSPGALASFGVSDGLTSSSAAIVSANGLSASDSARRIAPVVLTLLDLPAAVSSEAELVDWDETSFRLRWTTNDATPVNVSYLVLGGDEVSARVVEWVTDAGSAGPQAITGVGFRPSVVIHAHTGTSFTALPPATIADASLGLGVMDDRARQWAVTLFSADNRSPSQSVRYQRTDRALACISGLGSVLKQARLASMDPDGFSLEWDAGGDGSPSRAFSLALAGLEVTAGSFTKSTAPAPASQRVEQLSFAPRGLLFAGFVGAARALPGDDARLGLGVSSRDAQTATAILDRDNQGLSSTGGVTRPDRSWVSLEASGVASEASLLSMDPFGFSLRWDANSPSADEMLYLALGSSFDRIDVEDPGGPLALAVGDLNGDGIDDVVTSHPEERSLSVFLSDGPLSLLGPTTYSIPVHGAALALGDLNQDGALDVVTAGLNEGATEGQSIVLLGDEWGELAEPTAFSTGLGPTGVVVFDANLDGHLDVVVTDSPTNSVVLLGGDGHGELGSPSSFAAGSGPTGLAAGDLDGDRITDLVVCSPADGGFSVLTGDGAGGFGAPTSFAAGSGPVGVALGDLDGDDVLDVALADPPGDQAIVLLGDGVGGFGDPAGFATGSGPAAIVVELFDDDCRPDVAVSNGGGEAVGLLFGDGFGGLGSPHSFAVGGAPSGLCSGNFDGDSRPDLATTTPANGHVVLLANNQDELHVDVEGMATSCAGETLALSLTASDPDAVSHRWDFGDGTEPEVVTGLGPVVHEYVLPGDYEVLVVAEDGVGRCLAQRRLVVEVMPALIAAAGAPTLVCTAEPPGLPFEVLLDGTASWSRDDATTWIWETEYSDAELLGEGNRPTLRISSPDWIDSVPVSLTLRDSRGCEDSDEVVVDFVRPPTLRAEPEHVCPGELSTLSASPGYDRYNWSHGDSGAVIRVAPLVTARYSLTSGYGDCEHFATVTVSVDRDEPISVEVRGLRMVKGDAGSVLIGFEPLGVSGYNLHRSSAPQSLGDASPHLYVATDEGGFVDRPPTGGLMCYDVRGASSCSRSSGP